MTVIDEIALRHFGRKTVKALSKRGIRVVDMQASPGRSGTYLDSVTVYGLADNGTFRLRTFLEVLALAK